MDHDFEISDGKLKKYHGKENNVAIPEGVTSIARLAFFRCEQLRKIKLPDSLTEIGDQAFSDCIRLYAMTFPDHITHIGDRIFEHCRLDEITIFGETFDLNEIAEEYDREQIAEDYGLDEGEFDAVSEAVAETAASEVPVLLINGQFDGLYMPKSIRCALINRALKHQPTNRNFLNMVNLHQKEIAGNLL